MAAHGEDTKPEKVKLVFLGDQAVGKTSILNRFMYDNFDARLDPTVGMDFVMKNIYRGDKVIKIMLWDTAGQEKFKSLIPSYLVDAAIALVVYDITSRSVS